MGGWRSGGGGRVVVLRRSFSERVKTALSREQPTDLHVQIDEWGDAGGLEGCKKVR